MIHSSSVFVYIYIYIYYQERERERERKKERDRKRERERERERLMDTFGSCAWQWINIVYFSWNIHILIRTYIIVYDYISLSPSSVFPSSFSFTYSSTLSFSRPHYSCLYILCGICVCSCSYSYSSVSICPCVWSARQHFRPLLLCLFHKVPISLDMFVQSAKCVIWLDRHVVCFALSRDDTPLQSKLDSFSLLSGAKVVRIGKGDKCTEYFNFLQGDSKMSGRIDLESVTRIASRVRGSFNAT